MALFAIFGNSQTQILGFDTKFGAKAGVNIASVTDSDSKVGAYFGGYARFDISDKFSFQPEVLFSMQGGKSDVTQTVGPLTVKAKSDMKLNYINIPLMVQYQIIEGLRLEAGPQLGFAVTKKTNLES